ncbi:MAG: C-terminal target protein [Crocinitomicaceae bacterium]|jgi:hypothetical protein|nr:C-terminal target protein [Crocinitomicaceae bacterium]
MKLILPLFILLFAAPFFLAQDYFPLSLVSTNHFTKTISVSIKEIYSIKIDSVANNGTETRYYNYRQIDPAEMNWQEHNLMSSTYTDLEGRLYSTRSSWLSNEGLNKTNSQDILFLNSMEGGTDIELRYQAPVDSQWIFYTRSNFRVWALVDTIVEMDVLGTMDSVKIIRLNTTNLSNAPVNHAFNNKEIWISKTNGFIKCYQFVHFPDVNEEITLVGKDLTGIHPLTNDDLPYRYPGDLLIYAKNGVDQSEEGTVTSLNYAYQLISDLNINGAYRNYTSQCLNHELGLNYYQPDYQQSCLTGSDFFALSGQCFINPYDEDWRTCVHVNYLSDGVPMIRALSFNPSNEQFLYPETYINGRDSRYGTTHGLELRIEYFQNTLEELPFSITEIVWTPYYYASDSVTGFGTYISPFQVQDVQTDSINMCTGLVSLDYTQANWADSLSWSFSDGFTSDSAHIEHAFLSAGSHPYSLELHTVFGDTILHSSVTVGDYPEYDQEISYSKHYISCYEFGLENATVESDSSFWILADESVVPGNSCTHVGTETGNDTLYLANYYGFCSDTLRCILHIDAMAAPVAPEFPLTETFIDLTYFKLNNNYVYSNIPAIPIDPGAFVDSLMRGCYQFTFQQGQQVNVKAAAQYLLEEWSEYYERDYSLWIDYNNDGSFTSDEIIFYHEADLALDWIYNVPTINVNENFTVSYDAVVNTPLRMRVVPDSLRQGQVGIDFAMIVTEAPTTGLVSLSQEQIYFAPNPTSDFVQLKLDSGQTGHIEMTDQSGKMIWEKANCYSGEMIDLSGLASGIYLLHYELNDGNTGVFKVCKE